jgi:hypothetical protein
LGFKALDQRLRQNAVQDKLEAAWIGEGAAMAASDPKRTSGFLRRYVARAIQR